MDFTKIPEKIHTFSPLVNSSWGNSQLKEQKQILCHLIRLDELHLERIYLAEETAKFCLDHEIDKMASEKHSEANLRTIKLRERLLKIIKKNNNITKQGEKIFDRYKMPKSVATQLVSTIAELRYVNKEIIVSILDKILELSKNKNNSFTDLLKRNIIRWVHYHYVSKYIENYVPVVSKIAKIHLIKLSKDRLDTERQEQVKKLKNIQENNQYSSNIRQTQLVNARIRLETAQKNAFKMRKRLLLLRDWVTGRQKLQNGKKINNKTSIELLHRIRRDLLIGDLSFVFQLADDNGKTINSIAF